MANLGEVGTSSFDAYEGIRIFIPGAITFALSIFALRSVAPSLGEKVGSDAVVSLIASVMLGLVLYYWDLPAKAAANSQNQPTDWLEERYPDKSKSEIVSAYLEILNTVVPPTIRNRALYMGSMYRIGLEFILALATSAAVVLGYGIWVSPPGVDALTVSSQRLWAAGAIALTFIFAFVVSIGYQRKLDFRTGSSRTLGGLLVGSVGSLKSLGMMFYLAGAVLITVSQLGYINGRIPGWLSSVIELVGFGTCYVYWIVRYVRGDKTTVKDPRKRVPMAAPTSGLLVMLPMMWALMSRGPETSDPLVDNGYLVGWTCLVCVAVLSIVFRGHERKLHGSYNGQRRWLEHNIERCEWLVTGVRPSESSSAGGEIDPSDPKRHEHELGEDPGTGGHLSGRRICDSIFGRIRP